MGVSIFNGLKYFYDLGEYGALHDYLLQKKQVIGSRQGSFPVAAVVEPDQRRGLHQTQYGKWAVSCRTAVCKNGDQQWIAVIPTLYVNDRALAEKILSWGFVLVCAIPTTEGLRPAPAPHLRPSARMNFTVINGAQVCQYRLGGTEAFPPP